MLNRSDIVCSLVLLGLLQFLVVGISAICERGFYGENCDITSCNGISTSNSVLTDVSCGRCGVYDAQEGYWGSEFHVSLNFSDGGQYMQMGSYDSRGGYILLYSSKDGASGDNYTIHLQSYFPNGTKRGSSFQVTKRMLILDAYISYNMVACSSTLHNGNIVVCYRDQLYEGGNCNIFCQLLNPDFQRIGEEIFVKQDAYAGGLKYVITEVLSNGNFAITYNTGSTDIGVKDAFFQIFFPNGTVFLGEQNVTTYTTDDQILRTPSVMASFPNDDSFIIVWYSSNQDGVLITCRAQLFWNNGTKKGSEFRVDSGVGASAESRDVVVVTFSDNHFVIAYRDKNNQNIKAQIFNANSTKRGDLIDVNIYTDGSQVLPSIIGNDDGSFFIAWGSDHWSSYGVSGQFFDSNGNKIGSEFRINEEDSSFQNYDICECPEGYLGKECEDWECFGIDKKLTEIVCSGHGKCEKPDICECSTTQYFGDDCNENLYIYVILAPVVSFLGIISLGVVGVIVVIILLCCCCCLVLGCICCSILFCCFSIVLLDQLRKLRKFGKLENLDMLLAEQEVESDTSIAHLKVNKHLFEIQFEEIKVEKILGEGGSDSVVYKANWRGQAIAFKCFKTRQICVNQDKFDEFEKEVEIFSSISHPNIVRFFGCTMKPPRVGIVMEFCENGEVLNFVVDFHSKKSFSYPIEEKVRILHETAQGMEYMHDRAIIHRDLKPQNILLDRLICPKLMDFGVSKLSSSTGSGKTAKTKRVGTCLYMAPEVCLSEKYDEKCDVFSYSILCYVLLIEHEHLYDAEDYGIEFKVANDPNYRPKMEIVKEYMKHSAGGTKYLWLCSLINRTWMAKPSQRPSFREINELFQIQARRKADGELSVEELMDGEEENGSSIKGGGDGEDDEKKKSYDDLVLENQKLEMELEYYRLRMREDDIKRRKKDSEEEEESEKEEEEEEEDGDEGSEEEEEQQSEHGEDSSSDE